MMKIDSIPAWKIRLFLWRYLPAAAFMGVRLADWSDTHCAARITYRWVNRNPFGSMYFAAQAAAAELSTGWPAFRVREQYHRQFSMLIIGMQATYHQKATGIITFRTDQVDQLHAAVQQAMNQEEPVIQEIQSIGRNAIGEVVSEFTFTWRFRRRRPV